MEIRMLLTSRFSWNVYAPSCLALRACRGRHLAALVLLLVLTILHHPALAGLGSWGGDGPWINQVEAIAVDPFDPQHLLVGTVRGFLQSRDGGSSWDATHLGAFPATVAGFDPVNAGIVYAAHRQGLYKSLDGGFSWALIPMPAAVVDLEIDPSDGDRLYALLDALEGDSSRVQVSDNGGTSWRAVGPAEQAFRKIELTLDPSDPSNLVLGAVDTVWRTADRGETWQQLEAPAGSMGWYAGLAFDPSNSSILYVGGSKGAYRSIDDGQHWQPTGFGPLFTAELWALDGGRLFILGETGIQRSLDEGQSWQIIRNYGGSQNARTLVWDPSNPGKLYAGTRGDGLLISDDWGESWSVIDLPNRFVVQVESMAIAASAPPVLYAGTHGGGLFRSTDGGQSWLRSSHGLADDRVHTIAIAPSDPETLWAGTPIGVFYSSDGGEHWSHRPFEDPGATPLTQRTSALAVDRRDTLKIFAGTAKGVRRSLDGGLSWQTVLEVSQNSFETIFSLSQDPHDPDHIVAMSLFTIYQSLDGGSTWSLLNTVDFTFKVRDWLFDPLLPGRAWVAASDGAFVTQDGGATFAPSRDGLCDAECKVMDGLAWAGPDLLLARSFSELFASRDGGQTWLPIPTDLSYLFSLEVHPWSSSTFYLGSSLGVRNFVDPRCDAPTTLCLQDERFRLEASWRDFETRTGRASFLPLDSDDSSVGWFFDPDNWEVLAKVIDGTGTDGHFWIFAGVASNVETMLRVTDTRTGQARHYHSPLAQTPGTLAEIGVFDADAPAQNPEVLEEDFVSLDTTPSPNRLRGFDPSVVGQGCTPSATRACLGGAGRFRVEVSWTDFTDQNGVANLVPQGSSDSTLWWFFSDSNWELLMKVIDGCGTNGRHWVFASSTTNVGYELTVTDTTTGEVVTYTSPLGQPAPTLTDTQALAGCEG